MMPAAMLFVVGLGLFFLWMRGVAKSIDETYDPQPTVVVTGPNRATVDGVECVYHDYAWYTKATGDSPSRKLSVWYQSAVRRRYDEHKATIATRNMP